MINQQCRRNFKILLRIGGKHELVGFGLPPESSDFRVMEKNLSLQNVINAVREFHDAFKIPNSDRPNARD